MFQDIKKELQVSTKDGMKKLVQNTVKLTIFVISCWMFLGVLAIGIFVPVYVFQVLKSPKEMSAIQVVNDGPGDFQRKVQKERTVSILNRQEPRMSQQRVSTRNDFSQGNLRDQIMETRNVIDETRRLGNGFSNFVKN